MTSFTESATFLKNVTIHGDLLPRRERPNLLKLSSSDVFHVPFENWRVHDAINSFLPSTSSGDDLALIGGTFGTNGWYLETADTKGATNTMYARQMIRVPSQWAAAESLTLSFYAGMITSVSDGTATIDAEAYKMDRAGSVSGSDVVSTDALTINSTTLAEKNFSLSIGTLSAGDLLDLRIAIAISDSLTGTVVKGRIGDVRFLVDTY